MAIFSRIKSAISRAFTPKSTGITPTSSSSRNAASAFNAISGLASSSKVTPSTATVARSSSGAQMSYAPQMTPLPATATQTVNSILAGVTPQRTNAPQYSSAPQYTPDPTLPIYGSPVSISGGQRPSSSEMAMTSDPSIISTQSFAPSSNTSTSNFNAGGVTGTTTSSSAPSVGDAPTYSNPGLIDNTALIKELSNSFDYDTEKRQFIPKTQGTQATQTDSIEETLRGFLPKKENLYEDPAIQLQQDEIRKRQQEVNAYASQLNSIVAKQNADLLNLRGIGSQEGVTETVYGGQVAQINREAAIRALPVQAQLASAQGNLQLAQDYLGQLTTWKKEEIQNNYDYKKGLYDLIRDRVTGAEKRQLDKIEKDAEQKRKLQANNLDFAQSIATEALKTGQRDVANRLMSLMQNPDDPQFMEKVRREAGDFAPATTGGYTDKQEKVINNIDTSIANNFSYKAVNSAKGFTDGVLASLKQQNGLSDIAAINQFQKVIDEGAVTREQDVRLVQQAQSLADSLKLRIKRLQSGDQLSPSQRTEMESTVKALYEAKVRSLMDDPYIASQTLRAERYGIDTGDTIIGQLGVFQNNQGTNADTTTPESLRSKYGY